MAEQVVAAVNPDGSLIASGSVTGTVSVSNFPATQNVAVTGQPIGVSGTVAAWSVANPAVTGSYSFSISDVAGVVAANNFVSLFNPVGSGKTFAFGGVFISSHVVNDVTTPSSMRGLRITAASGGTLATNSTDIAKFATSQPASVAQVRTANPTVTVGPPFFNSPPIESAAKTSSATVQSVLLPPGSTPFTFAPGEGMVIQTTVGDVDQRWNITVVWNEI